MRFSVSLPLAAVAVAGSLLAPSVASADEVSPTGKGITGGALLGGEVVMLTEAAAGVKPAWAYAVGGIVGAAGGGVGGYFAEQNGSAKLSLYLLAGGMAFVIPTTVAVLSTTAYTPPASYTEDKGPTGEPVAEPAQPAAAPATGASAPTSQRVQKRHRRVARAHFDQPLALYRPVLPPALLGYGLKGITLSVPALEVGQVYTRAEQQAFGVKQATELQVPVFNYVF